MEVTAELRGEGVVGLVYRLIDHSFTSDMSCPLPDSQSKTGPPYRLHPHYPSTPETRLFLKANPLCRRTCPCARLGV